MKFIILTLTETSTGYYHPSDEYEFRTTIDMLCTKQGYQTMDDFMITRKQVDCMLAVLGKERD